MRETLPPCLLKLIVPGLFTTAMDIIDESKISMQQPGQVLVLPRFDLCVHNNTRNQKIFCSRVLL